MVTAPTPSGQTILVVDDNDFITSILRQGLVAEGYDVTSTGDGLAALDLIATSPPDLILLDVEMPGLSGDEVCRRLKTNPTTRLIPVVMVTGLDAFPNKMAAWDYGADDFLTKPFHLVEVLARCRSLLRIKRLIEDRDSAEAVVFALARAVEAKSEFTAGHSERVMRLALALAADVGVAPEHRERLAKGALLHDVGKIRIPDAILNKPGRLTAEEFAVIREHPATGAHIVEPLASVRDAVPLIRSHHERLDGTGYPDGLSGDAIEPLVRILSVCDVYDSLATDRPYRPAVAFDDCLMIMRDNARGGGLDPALVDRFAALVRPPVGGHAMPAAALPPGLLLDAEHLRPMGLRS